MCGLWSLEFLLTARPNWEALLLIGAASRGVYALFLGLSIVLLALIAWLFFFSAVRRRILILGLMALELAIIAITASITFRQ
jgi:hypothetical protein